MAQRETELTAQGAEAAQREVELTARSAEAAQREAELTRSVQQYNNLRLVRIFRWLKGVVKL